MTNIAALRHPSTIGKVLVAMVLALVMAFTTMTPSRADQTAVTRNIILGAAAAAAGVVLYNNYQHKKAEANTIVGYTQDGGTIYADGRIVYPNGQTVYPNNNGQYGYYGNNGYNGYNGQYSYANGQHRGWYQGRGNPHHIDGDGD